MGLSSKQVNTEKNQHGISAFTWTLVVKQPINQIQISADFQIWQEAQHNLAVCIPSTESQPYPGLHQRQRGQKGEGADSPPLLRFGETPPSVLHPALGFPVQGGIVQGQAGRGFENLV